MAEDKAEEGWVQLEKAVEMLVVQMDECAKSQKEFKMIIREVEAAIAAED